MKDVERMNRGFYFCYSKKLSAFLQQNGMKYVTIAKDMNTKKIFSLFIMTKELEELLKEYTLQRK